MPWHVEPNRDECGPDAPYAVLRDATADRPAEVIGCFTDEAAANAAIDELTTADAGGAGNDTGGDTNAPPAAGGYAGSTRQPTAVRLAAAAPTAVVPAEPGPPASGAPEVEVEVEAPEAMPMPGMGGPGSMPANCVAWDGVLAVEGAPTGDGRAFTPGALTWADLPIPLRWQAEDTHGGVLVNGVVTIGRIDAITRVPAADGMAEIRGAGVIDTGSPEGLECARRMGTAANPGFLSGISIDADDPTNATVEYVMPTGCDTPPASEADAMRCAAPELTVYHAARIRAATLCDIPAFVQARVYLTDPAAFTAAETALEGGGACGCDGPSVDAVIAAAHTIHLTVPDPGAFTEPREAPDIGAITLTDDGRIFGYLAPRGIAHRGYPDRVITVPLGNVDYTRWMNRATICAGGTRIATGAITMDCGHAPTHPSVSAAGAAAHYDNTCSIVATARIGENRHGVWIAGALLADVTPAQIARLLACQLSGDWRPSRERPGQRELCGVLAVPVPGFPVAHRGMRVHTEAGQLVASAVPIRHGAAPPAPAPAAAAARASAGITAAARILATATGRDRASRLAALRSTVKGT